MDSPTPEQRFSDGMGLYWLIVLILVLLAAAFGCARDASRDLTEQQKFEMSKKCIDAGMYPDIWSTKVRCMAVPDSEVER